MKVSHPFLLTALCITLLPVGLLNGCITPAPLGPRPTAGMRGPVAPSPSDQSTPAPTPTPTPTPAPDISAPPSAGSCDTSSASVSFVVYANPRNLDLYYPAYELDTNTPLSASSLQFGTSVQQNTAASFCVSRASLAQGFEIRHTGYASVKRLDGEGICSKMYVGMSPLSVAEQQGQPVTMADLDLYSVGALPPGLNQDPATNFSYAVYREAGSAAPFLKWLDEQSTMAKVRAAIDAAFAQGKMVVLFSNNSSQMGDLYQVLSLATETPSSLVLASHIGGMVQYPRPSFPYGDIFNKRLEIKLLPKSSKPVVFEALRAGVGAEKVTVEAQEVK